MQNNNDHIIHAYKFDGQGSGIKVSEQNIANELKDISLAWVHLDATHENTREWLIKNVDYLDHIIIDALLADETRPRILEFDEGTLLILRGVNLNDNSEPEDMISIRLWIDQNRIISLQRRPLKATNDIKERLISGKGPKNSGDFLAALSFRLFERMDPIFLELDERLDDVEESVLDNPDIKERQEITSIRRQAIVFKRYIVPQRDVIAHLRTSEQPWLDQMHKRRLQESLDRVIRYVEDLDTIRERAQIIKDELSSILADKMNKNMYILSVIAAIFLPLGFLTGLLGINIGGIPGADNNYAFLIFCGMLASVVAFQTVIFKKLKWF